MATSVCPVRDDVRVFDDPNRIAGLVMFIVGIIYFPVTLVLWMRRSNHPYLRARNFPLICIMSFGLTMQLVTTGLSNFIGRKEFPCDVTLWLSYLMLPLGAAPVALQLLIAANRAQLGQYIADAAELDDAFDPDLFKSGSLWARLMAYARSINWSCCSAGRGAGDAEDGPAARTLKAISRKGMPGDSTRSLTKRDAGLAVFFGQSTTFLVLVLAAIALPAVIYAIVLSADSDQPFGSKGCYGCTLAGTTFVPVLIEGAIVLIFGFALIYMVRKAQDPLHVLRDVRIAWWLGVAFAASLLLSEIDPAGLRGAGQFDWIYLGVVMIFAVHTVLVLIPLLRTYKQIKRDKNEELTLDAVMADARLKEAFKSYLVAAFSVENLVFVENVNFWRAQYNELSDEDASRRVAWLFDTFLREGAMLEVNISSTSRRAARVMLEAAMGRGSGATGKRVSRASMESARVKPDETMFDESYNEVWEILLTDSFPRFLKSSFLAEARGKGGSVTGPAIAN